MAYTDRRTSEYGTSLSGSGSVGRLGGGPDHHDPLSIHQALQNAVDDQEPCACVRQCNSLHAAERTRELMTETQRRTREPDCSRSSNREGDNHTGCAAAEICVSCIDCSY